MTKKSTHARHSAIGAISLFLITGWIIWYVTLFTNARRQNMIRWRQQLLSTEDRDVALLLHETAKESPSGIAKLVSALGSDRANVSNAANRVIHGLIDQWRLDPPDNVALCLPLLASELATSVSDLHPRALGDASNIAERILLTPVKLTHSAQERLIANCRQIIQVQAAFDATDSPARKLARIDTLSKVQSRYIGQNPSKKTRPGHSSEFTPPSESEFPLPGGALPIRLTPMPDSRAVDLDLPSSGPTGGGSGVGSSKRPASPEPPRTTHSNGDLNASLPPGKIHPLALRAKRINRTPAEVESSEGISQFDSNISVTKELERLDDLSVMRNLHTKDKRVAQAAHQELQNRHFTLGHVQMARKLTDPDPKVRAGVAENLSRLPNINQWSWLQVLGQDDDPDVRLAAISIIATSRSVDAQKWLRNAYQRETNPRVLSRLRTILENR